MPSFNQIALPFDRVKVLLIHNKITSRDDTVAKHSVRINQSQGLDLTLSGTSIDRVLIILFQNL